MTHPTAKDIMTTDVVTATSSWSLTRLTELLLSRSISGAPVLDDDGKLIGVVSITDVTRRRSQDEVEDESVAMHDYYRNELAHKLGSQAASQMSVVAEPDVTVADIMTPIVFDVDADDSVQSVAGAMLKGHVHRVCVTRKGELVGVISAFDMLRVVRDL